jgi:hypothetical protein
LWKKIKKNNKNRKKNRGKKNQKIKSINNFEKIIKKTMWGNTIVIYGVLKKKNYKAKFLNNSILKNKIDKNIFIKKLKQKNKKNPKNNKKVL